MPTAKTSKLFSLFLFFLILLSGCTNYKRLVTDEVILKDQNSQTGTIIKCDSSSLTLRKMDESKSIIQWSDIDTIVGKKLKTFWVGSNIGYYSVPYFSVFRNAPMRGKALGIQYKLGMAYRGNKLCYFQLTYIGATPYDITKTGFGYQYYLGQTTYLKKNAFFVGGEFNMMTARYNNGPQLTLEPFTGFERKLAEHVRVHVKLQLQFNLASKNNESGLNLSVGFHFMRKNFKKRYDFLNTQRKLYGK